jgi:hypothetical protein
MTASATPQWGPATGAGINLHPGAGGFKAGVWPQWGPATGAGIRPFRVRGAVSAVRASMGSGHRGRNQGSWKTEPVTWHYTGPRERW